MQQFLSSRLMWMATTDGPTPQQSALPRGPSSAMLLVTEKKPIGSEHKVATVTPVGRNGIGHRAVLINARHRQTSFNGLDVVRTPAAAMRLQRDWTFPFPLF
jgi:hypothetical protein